MYNSESEPTTIKRSMKLGMTCVALLITAAAASMQATPITPTYTTFGTLADATFGGSGIPNDAVAITTIMHGGNTITLGLSAFERYSNPAVGNNGAGTFFATPGANTGDPMNPLAPPNPLGTTWGFGYYMNITGGGTFADYNFDLVYDLIPGAGTDAADHGTIDVNLGIVVLAGTPLALAATTKVQDSQTLMFGFLGGVPAAPFITPPTGFPPATFDPNATGEYTFALRVADSMNAPLGESAIQVNVVPEPSSLALLGLSLISAALFAARRRDGQRAA